MSSVRKVDPSAPVFPTLDPPGVGGVLRVIRFVGATHDVSPQPPSPIRGVATFVRGHGYRGMEDNDLRGFLDGRFICGWNQPGQGHIRIGRVASEVGSSAPPGQPPPYGEHELFRVLLRWENLALPPGAHVDSCRLELTVERGCGSPLHILMYEVKKDWEPGAGGVDSNNVSVPKLGEVWWNDAAYEKNPWGLPGAGFASEDHPAADTGLMPLGEASYEPGDETLVFASSRLDRYAAERIAGERPLLFLLKLADLQEDIPGAQVAIYSANHGDSRNIACRPRLVIQWAVVPHEVCLEQRVVLERGRSYLPPPIPVSDDSIYWVQFVSEEGYGEPAVQWRSEDDRSTPEWSRVLGSVNPRGDRLELRIVAAEDPVALGQAFTARMKDTWVLTAPPEDQEVLWTFVSPTGREREVHADYRGQFSWEVTFVPDEIGPWRYRWTQNFTRDSFTSAEGRFDVLAMDREGVLSCMEELGREIVASSEAPTSTSFDAFRLRFSRLQRAAIVLDGPDGLPSPRGADLRRRLDSIRSLLWAKGKPIPDPIPMRSMPLRYDVDGTRLADPIPLDVHTPFRGEPTRRRGSQRARGLVNGLRRIRVLLERWKGRGQDEASTTRPAGQ